MKATLENKDQFRDYKRKPRTYNLHDDKWKVEVSNDPGYALTVTAKDTLEKRDLYIENPEPGVQIQRTLTLELSAEDLIRLFDKAISEGLLSLVTKLRTS